MKGPMKTWEQEEIFHSGDKFFDSLLRDLESAKTSIELETYIFSSDHLGRGIVKALNDAASRGVKVRMIVDGVGSGISGVWYLLNKIHENAEARIFHPLPWALFLGPLGPTTKLALFMKWIMGANRRDHRKLCVIDGHTAYVSSMNISSEHLESDFGKSAWRDTGVRVEGAAVRDLQGAFERAWSKAGRFLYRRHSLKSQGRTPRRFRRSGSGALVRLNDNWKRRRKAYQELVDRINRAQDRIYITNAYFIPHRSFIGALCAAAARGVDVRLLVPRRCDVFFVPWVRAAFYFVLLSSKVKIYEYLPRMLHAKTMIIDDWALVGSSNLNHRSLRHDLEADVVLTMEKSKLCLARQFAKDIKEAQEISPENWHGLPFIQSGTGQALLLLKNWM